MPLIAAWPTGGKDSCKLWANSNCSSQLKLNDGFSSFLFALTCSSLTSLLHTGWHLPLGKATSFGRAHKVSQDKKPKSMLKQKLECTSLYHSTAGSGRSAIAVIWNPPAEGIAGGLPMVVCNEGTASEQFMMEILARSTICYDVTYAKMSPDFWGILSEKASDWMVPYRLPVALGGVHRPHMAADIQKTNMRDTYGSLLKWDLVGL